jgi:LysM repeat protein
LPADPATSPTIVASNQPNAMTPTGAPVIVEGATVQTPGGDPVPGTDGAKEYVVQSGDTLSKIAKANAVSVGDLRWWNNILNPYSLKVGQSLKLYAAADLQPKEAFEAQAVAAEKARKEAAAAKSDEGSSAAPPPSSSSNSGGTLEGQFRGQPAAPVNPPPAKEEKKPRRGLFRGIFQGR